MSKLKLSAAHDLAKGIQDGQASGQNEYCFELESEGAENDDFLWDIIEKLGDGRLETVAVSECYFFFHRQLTQLLAKYYTDESLMEPELDQFLETEALRILQNAISSALSRAKSEEANAWDVAEKKEIQCAVKDLMTGHPDVTAWLFESAKADVILHFERKILQQALQETIEESGALFMTDQVVGDA